MSRLLARSSRRHLARHRWQLGLSVAAVALGVAVVVAIDLANGSARRAFSLAAETVGGRATHQVTGSGGRLPGELYRRLRVELGARPSAPVLEAAVTSPAAPGRSFTLLGVDPLAEEAFRPWLAAFAPGEGVDLGSFLTRPGAALLAAETARELDLVPGDELPLLVGGRQRSLTLVGTLAGRDESSRRALAGLMVVDVATAQELLARPGELTRIDLLLPEGEAGAALLARVEAALPPGARLERAASRSRALDEMTRAFRVNLTALSLLALLCGAFLIYNSMTFSVVQRRRLIGLLRALGVTRREVFALVLGEAAAVGAAGAAIGLALGALLSRGLLRLVGRTIDDLYFSLSVTAVDLDPLVLAKGAALGVGAALAAALAPAREATAAPPRAVWSRSLLEERSRRGVPRAAAAGLALGAAGALLLALPGKSLLVALAGLLTALLGCALVAPAATLLFARAAAPVAGRLFGLLGRMAARGIAASLSRTAVAIATLMIAVSMTVGVGIMIGSFRGTVVDWLETTLRADVYASVPGGAGGGGLDEAFLARVRALPGVERVNSLTPLTVATERGPVRLQVIDLDHRSRGAFDFAAGDPQAAWAALVSGEAVLLSEPFAYRTGLSPGDVLTLPTDRGEVPFPVAGVYVDYSSDQGAVTLSRRAFDRFWRPRPAAGVALFAAPGVDPDRLVRALEELAAAAGLTLQARSNRALKEASMAIFDRTFLITEVLRLLAGLVAFAGVLAALMALELERARELGVLRANGLTPRQLWWLVTAQTGMLGLLAGLLSIPVGLLMAAIMVYVINRRSFGWSLEMAVAPEMLLSALGLALGAALLAGLYPAWRMARTSPAAALREE